MSLSKRITLPIAGFLLALLATHPGVAAASPKLDGPEILRRAEEIRNPPLDHAIEATVRILSPEGRAPERETSFSLVTRSGTGTMLLRRSPEILTGAVLMIEGDQHWSLTPKGTKPAQLTEGQVIFGDIQSADLSRLDLSKNWEAVLLGEERFEEDACYKLELKRTGGSGIYTRILYWVEKKDFLPRRLELYGTETGRLLRMVRYEDFRKGSLGTWPGRMLVEGGNSWEEMSAVAFSNPRKVEVASLTFGTKGMLRFRDAAKVAGQAPVESVLALLASNPPPSPAPDVPVPPKE